MQETLVVVTGGSGLIGTGVINKLIVQGKRVFSLDIKSPNIYSRDFQHFPCDISDQSSVDESIRSMPGLVSNIIHCAAIDPKVTSNQGTAVPFQEQEFDSIGKEFDIAIRGGLNVIQSCLRRMSSEPSVHKSIVLMGSDLSVISPDQRIYIDSEGRQTFLKPISYSILKHGLVGMTKYLSTILADRNIHVNCLSPGPVLDRQPENLVRELIHRIPIGRLATVEEIADVAMFLCSSQSSYITGQNIVVDGGRTTW